MQAPTRRPHPRLHSRTVQLHAQYKNVAREFATAIVPSSLYKLLLCAHVLAPLAPLFPSFLCCWSCLEIFHFFVPTYQPKITYSLTPMHPSVTTVYHSYPLAMRSQPTLTIDSIRLGGIDVALAIMEEQSEDSESTIQASRLPSIVSVGNQRDTLMLLEEFECLAAKTKRLPVSSKRPDLPATRRLDNSTTLPLHSRTRPTFPSREILVDDLGRTHFSSAHSVSLCARSK